MSVTVTEPGIYPDVPEREYHSDPALSQSGAKLLLKSPALYKWRRDHPEHKDVFDFGTAAHAKVLGVGLDVAVIDTPSGEKRGKEWTEGKERARADGKVPILRRDMDVIDAMAAALGDHAGARAILRRDGTPEVSMWWTERSDIYYADVDARGRVDWTTTTASGDPILVDYKSTVDASPAGFRKSVANYGYDIQSAAYRAGWHQCTGDRPRFVLIAQEKEPPYLVGLYSLDWTFEARGERLWQDAIDIYATCSATDTWPGYAADITELTPPRWAE